MRPQGFDVTGRSGSRHNYLKSSVELTPTIKREKKSKAQRRIPIEKKEIEREDQEILLLPAQTHTKNKIMRLEWTHIMTWINFSLIVLLAVVVGVYYIPAPSQHEVVKTIHQSVGNGTPFIITSDSQDTLVKLTFLLKQIRRFEVCCKQKNVIFCTGSYRKKKLEIQAHLSIKDNHAHIRAHHPDMVGIPCNLYVF